MKYGYAVIGGWASLLCPRRDFVGVGGRVAHGADRLCAGVGCQLDRRPGQPPGRSRHHPLLFRAGPRRPPRRLPDRRRREGALRAPACSRTFASASQGGRLVVTVVENPVINRIAFEGNSRSRTSSSRPKSSPRRAARCRALWCRPTCSASSRSTGAAAASICASSRRSSSCRTTASISSSRSTRAGRPASSRSSSSATGPIRPTASRTSIKTVDDRTFCRFLQSSDIYDPDRIEADRDCCAASI